MAAHPSFAGCRVAVFDAYGTLFDVAAAARRLAPRIGPEAGRLAEIWRAKQLQYTWLRSLMGRYADFWTVTGEALDFALEATGIRGEGLRGELMDLYRRLDAYDDVKPMLGRLKAAGMKTAILSNGEPGMLAQAVDSAGIGGLLDDVISVHELGIYKPHPLVYALVERRLGPAPAEVVFLSSNGWDAAAAGAFGFRVAWVNRSGQPMERLPAAPDATITGLDGLPPLLGL
ncbi:MAG: haloacid dehalogenase type II [Thalassobaculales bacterium]